MQDVMLTQMMRGSHIGKTNQDQIINPSMETLCNLLTSLKLRGLQGSAALVATTRDGLVAQLRNLADLLRCYVLEATWPAFWKSGSNSQLQGTACKS